MVLDLSDGKIPVVRGSEKIPVVLDPRKIPVVLCFRKNVSGLRSRGKFQWSEVLKNPVVLDPGKIPVVLCFGKTVVLDMGENSSGPRF